MKEKWAIYLRNHGTTDNDAADTRTNNVSRTTGVVTLGIIGCSRHHTIYHPFFFFHTHHFCVLNYTNTSSTNVLIFFPNKVFNGCWEQKHVFSSVLFIQRTIFAFLSSFVVIV